MEQFADQTATPDVRAGNKGARAREQSNRLNRKSQNFSGPGTGYGAVIEDKLLTAKSRT